MSGLILPGNPLFDLTLATSIPPGWRQIADRAGEQTAFVASAESGILRPVDRHDLTEYLYDGEYDERMEAIEEIDSGLDYFGDFDSPDQLDAFPFNPGADFSPYP